MCFFEMIKYIDCQTKTKKKNCQSKKELNTSFSHSTFLRFVGLVSSSFSCCLWLRVPFFIIASKTSSSSFSFCSSRFLFFFSYFLPSYRDCFEHKYIINRQIKNTVHYASVPRQAFFFLRSHQSVPSNRGNINIRYLWKKSDGDEDDSLSAQEESVDVVQLSKRSSSAWNTWGTKTINI
jgi:hypothetical protein